MAMLEASPSFHCGGTFGHDASTAKVGTARGGCDCAWAPVVKSNAAATSGTMVRSKVMVSSRWPAFWLGPALTPYRSTVGGLAEGVAIPGSPAGACHRAGQRPDPLAGDDGGAGGQGSCHCER